MTTMTAQTTQVYQLFIRATPEAIWGAITRPEFTEQYFHGVRIELRDGRRYSRTAGGLEWDDPILESDPPRRLVHSWVSYYDEEMAAEPPSRVTWEIEAQDDGTTLLTVVHDRLDASPKTAEGVSGTGWMMVLSGLKTLLETGAPLARAADPDRG
jgi:uncharacterized protein YndB with AHSA1/START domain